MSKHDDKTNKGLDRRTFLKRSSAVMIGGALVPGAFNLQQVLAQGEIAGGELIAAMYQDPQGLDPQLNSQTESFQAMLGVFEQLYDYDPATDSFFPQLASEMPDASDPLNVVIPLRDDVIFHDGTPMTSADVAYTFNFVLETGPESPAYSLYSLVERVEAVDDHTVVFRMAQPYGLLTNYLTSVMGGIVKKDSRDTVDLRRAPYGVGTGPFEFVEWVQGSHLTFQAFPGYFRENVPKVQTLTYKILKDDATRVAQLIGGSINFLDEPPKRDFARLIARPDIDGAQGLSEKVGYVMINHANEIGSNVHVRRALSFATDREAILESVFEGYGQLARGPMKPGTAWYDPSVEEFATYDIDRARAELRAGGYETLSFDLLCENNTHHIDASTVLQATWAEAGINVNVVPMEKTAFYDRAGLAKPGWVAGYTDWSSSVYTPDYMIKLVFKSDGSYQRVSYDDPEVDGWIEEAQTTSDADRQNALFSLIQRKMAEDVAAVWVLWYDWTPVWSTRVKGFAVAPTYYEYFDNVSVEES